MTPDAPNAEMQRFEELLDHYRAEVIRFDGSLTAECEKENLERLMAKADALRDFVAALVRDKGRVDPDKLWDALRDVACSTGRDAKRIVMVTKQDVDKAVAAQKGQP